MARVNPPNRVPERTLTSLKNHLTKIQEALDLMRAIPEVGPLERGMAEHQLAILRDGLLSMEERLKNLKTLMFPSQKEMEQTANQLALKAVTLGNQVMDLQKDPSIQTMTQQEMLEILPTLQAEQKNLATITPVSPTPPPRSRRPRRRGIVTGTGLTDPMANDPLATVTPEMMAPMRTEDLTPVTLPRSQEDLEKKTNLRRKRSLIKGGLIQLLETIGNPLRVTINQEAETMTSLLMKAIESQKDPNNLNLRDLLLVSLEVGLIKPKAVPWVTTLVRMECQISLWSLATLDRQLAMTEMAKTHQVYPLLMRQTAHRNKIQHSTEMVKTELLSPNQRIFLRMEALRMLLI